MIEEKLDLLVENYRNSVLGVEEKAQNAADRAYGGVIRADKGSLVETLAMNLVEIAWVDVLKQDKNRLKLNKKKIDVKIREKYIDNLQDQDLKEYLENNKENLIYKFGTDVHVYIDNKLVLPIECKAYTENAMMKRILFDALLMKEVKGIDTYFLLQLESQLGGDYSQLNDKTYGSFTTHVLLSHVTDINLKIITLLKGERKVDKPIHKKDYFKELTKESLKKAINEFATELKKYI